MAIRTICSDEITNKKKSVGKNLEANLLKVECRKLVQYKTNPSGRNPLMFDIPKGTTHFDLSMKSYGGIKKYTVEAKDREGNTLNTFFYSG